MNTDGLRRIPDLKRALVAATAYFGALFSLGFVLGTVRVIVVTPWLGELAATLAEVPVMLTAAFFFCRWSIRHWQIPREIEVRCVMFLWFMALLFAFEALLGMAVFGRTIAEQWAALGTPAGILGLSAQVIAALFVAIPRM